MGLVMFSACTNYDDFMANRLEGTWRLVRVTVYKQIGGKLEPVPGADYVDGFNMKDYPRKIREYSFKERKVADSIQQSGQKVFSDPALAPKNILFWCVKEKINKTKTEQDTIGTITIGYTNKANERILIWDTFRRKKQKWRMVYLPYGMQTDTLVEEMFLEKVD